MYGTVFYLTNVCTDMANSLFWDDSFTVSVVYSL